MPELTAEQLAKTESMSLDELRDAAFAEAEGKSPEAPKSNATDDKKEQPRDENGRFASTADHLDPETDENPQETEAEEEDEPEIYRHEIENDDGSVDVYEAESWEALVQKIADAKKASVSQMKRVQAEKRELETRTQQNNADADYIFSEKFKQNPRAAVQEAAAEAIAAESVKFQRGQQVQVEFCNTHPSYVANPDNGSRLAAEYRRLYPNETEFHLTGLDKAYQSLVRSGLLQTRREEAGDSANDETNGKSRTETPRVEATQSRSSKRSSTVRSSASPTPAQGFSESEAYQMPLEKLRELAEKQLAGQS